MYLPSTAIFMSWNQPKNPIILQLVKLKVAELSEPLDIGHESTKFRVHPARF